MRQNHKLFLIVILLFCLPLSGCVTSTTGRNLSARTRLLETVADAGAQATVGIYYDESDFISYYGTGVVISPDGYILTSTTVIPPDSDGEIEIHFSDHTQRTARLVESNDGVEASLLKVDGAPLPHVPIAKKLPDLGERAYTFGNARHIMRVSSQPSFSAGRISGIYDVGSSSGLSSYDGLALETDAAVNPGQDGGPLLNARGQLTGIISLSFSDARWLGVAVPITRICESLKAIKQGDVTTSFYPMIELTPKDEQYGQAFREHAKDLSPSLVRLHVTREYGPEIMPRYFWPEYLEERSEDWENADTKRRQEMVASFMRAEKILKANQQVRRPADTTTGILISSDGYILTSDFNVSPDGHFVPKDDDDRRFGELSFDWDLGELLDDSDKYTTEKNAVTDVLAILDDGRSFSAKIVARHKPLDIALLKVDATDLPHTELPENPIDLQTGRSVALIGTKGTERPPTVNAGIISATSRQRGQYFQCSSMLNYANSGGPVIDQQGHLRGIATDPLKPGPITGAVLPITQIVQRWQFAPNSGIGLIARIDRIRDDLKTLKSGESVEHLQGGFLGVSMAPETVFREGAFVGRVLNDSAAKKAGVEKGDQILAINGVPLNSWKELTNEIMKYQPGDEIILQIRRPIQSGEDEVDSPDSDNEEDETQNYKTITLTVTLGERE